ncbi:MAG: AAA family ATPase [Candidatus Peribacteria bacterium]|jgi:predicted AAA+ superfamily ATPase|nr:AAA family ATPase [Candidatus Peribacteria bacterium]
MYAVLEEGVQTFFIDEIFRYDNRRQEIKNIFDSFPGIQIVFSGSSSMAVYGGVVDLGRRVYEYKVNTLSFREFLKLKYHIDLPKISFKDLLTHHKKLSSAYSLKFRQKYFREYLKS